MIAKPEIPWAVEWLEAHEYSISSGPDLIRTVPWSKVYRFETGRGRVYLKWSAPAYAREAPLMAYLGAIFPADILPILAINDAIGAFLTPDGGDPLRIKLKESYDPQKVAKLVSRYADIQRSFSGSVEELLAIGLDDWRMAVFSDLYDDLVKDQALLKREGMTTVEIQQLRHARENVRFLCATLSRFNVPETLEHCDFQDNNILANTNGFLINDWGDAVVAHPFFSLAGFLDSAVRNHGLDVNSAIYRHIKEAYFEVWLGYECQENLEYIFEIAQILRHVEFVFNFRHVVKMTGVEAFEPYRGHIAAALRKFLTSIG